jgi:hypothetical protein
VSLTLTPRCSIQIFALFMLTGVFSTLLIPETSSRSLEDISNEDQSSFAGGYAGQRPFTRRDSSEENLHRVVPPVQLQPLHSHQQRASILRDSYDPYRDA